MADGVAGSPGPSGRAGRVAGKVAVVTGAASGIGRATAELLAAEGASVVVADIDGDGAQVVARGIAEAGGQARAVTADVSDEAQVAAMIATAVEAFGALHVLHNNAALNRGEGLARDRGVDSLDLGVWDRSLEVNLTGTMLPCKHAVPEMIRAGGGSIINTASNLALAGDPDQSAYPAAKAGVIGLTKAVATAYGRFGIRCNVLSPGMIMTPAVTSSVPPDVIDAIAAHNLLPRLGQPEDMAQAVLFFASDESSFITGQTVCVDGGQLTHLPHYAYLRATGTSTTTPPT